MEEQDSNLDITRIDFEKRPGSGGAHGWVVRIRRRGRKIEKFFGDSVYGGSDAALEEARKFRDDIGALVPPLNRREIAEIKSRRNTSGIVGVSFVEKTTRKNDRLYTYHNWVATWTPYPGRQKKRSFSVEKYGIERALDMAIETRRKGLEDMVEITQRRIGRDSRRKNTGGDKPPVEEEEASSSSVRR